MCWQLSIGAYKQSVLLSVTRFPRHKNTLITHLETCMVVLPIDVNMYACSHILQTISIISCKNQARYRAPEAETIDHVTEIRPTINR